MEEEGRAGGVVWLLAHARDLDEEVVLPCRPGDGLDQQRIGRVDGCHLQVRLASGIDVEVKAAGGDGGGLGAHSGVYGDGLA